MSVAGWEMWMSSWLLLAVPFVTGAVWLGSCWFALGIRRAYLFGCGLLLATTSGGALWLMATGRIHPLTRTQPRPGDDLWGFLLVVTPAVAFGYVLYRYLLPLVTHFLSAASWSWNIRTIRDARHRPGGSNKQRPFAKPCRSLPSRDGGN